MTLSRTQRRRERRPEPLGSSMRVATYIRTGSPTPRRCTYDYMARRIWKKVEQNGVWYTYKTPDGCKGGWTCAKHAPRRGEDSMGRVRINYRYYNPVDGRWTRRDPLPQQGSSLHDYILNNPINTSDYLGLQLVMPYHAAKGVPGLTNSVNINQANQAWKFMRAFLCAFRAPTIDKPSPAFLEDQYNPNDEGDITRDYKAWLCSRLLYCI